MECAVKGLTTRGYAVKEAKNKVNEPVEKLVKPEIKRIFKVVKSVKDVDAAVGIDVIDVNKVFVEVLKKGYENLEEYLAERNQLMKKNVA